MTVYVDEPIYPFRGQDYCHMFTDGDISELHAMADAIGLKRAWFQNKPRFPHYDVAPSKRRMAVGFGAREITSREMVLKSWEKYGKVHSANSG